MDKIPFLDMFPCCAGADKSYGNLGAAFVQSATVNRERMAMTVRALFSAMPAPVELSALESAIAEEFGLREVKIEASWPQAEPRPAAGKSGGPTAGGKVLLGRAIKGWPRS